MSIDDQINNQKTCAERINDAFKDREQYIDEMIQACDDNEPFDGYDEPYEAFGNYFLGKSEYRVINLEISWGGPSDYFEVKLSGDDYGNYDDIVSIHYHFADWFDHASIKVETNSPVWDLVTRYIAYLD